MGKNPPQVQIRKFITDLSAEGISRAEAELESLLRLGIPCLDFSIWRRPTSNDLLEGGSGIEVPSGPDRELIFCYFGTRRTLVGAYLFAYIDIEKRDYLSCRVADLPFMKPLFADPERLSGAVVLGQTNPDLRALGRISGRRSDVFAYILGLKSGLDSLPIQPGEEGKREGFPAVEFATMAKSIFLSDDVVHISGWSFGRFLRRCFVDLSRGMSKHEFDIRFKESGVKWRPRFIRTWW